MATEIGVFSILNPEQCEWLGEFPAKDASELRSGLIGHLESGEIDLAAADDPRTSCGIVVSNRTFIYRPTEAFLEKGEVLGFVRGSNVQALFDQYFFVGDTLPSPGADLYLAAGGRMDVSGSVYIGKCFGADTVRSIPNTTKDVARCELTFTPL